MDDNRLDELLDTWRVEPASRSLHDRVLASAPRLRQRGSRLSVLPGLQGLMGVRLWLAGAGVAAGLAGVSCGAVISTIAVRDAKDEALVTAAVSDGSVAVSSFAEPARSL